MTLNLSEGNSPFYKRLFFAFTGIIAITLGILSQSTGINGDEKDNSADESGAAYLFTRTGTTWKQEAYVKAYSALVDGQFDGRSRVETWLYRIVVNGALDAKRKMKRTATDELVEETAYDEAGASMSATSAESVVALRELSEWLSALPEEQQAVLVLKAVEGMSSAEVAQVLEITEGAVEQRLVRARSTLREKRSAS